MANQQQIIEQIMDLLDGRLSADDARTVQLHVATDPEWSAAHQWLQQLTATDRTIIVENVPAHTRAALEALLPPRSTISDDIREVVRSIASLVRDIPAGMAVAGARGATTRRQLVFDLGDDADLVLELDATDQGIVITGQVLGVDDPHLAATADEGTTEVTVDEFGEFTFRSPNSTHLFLELNSVGRRTAIELTEFLDRSH